MAAKRIVVFGAGVAGLSAARHLSESGFEVSVYEKDEVIGGLARTFRKGGYLYDLGPHYFHQDLAEEVGIAGECEEVRFNEAVCLKGKQVSFPLGLAKDAGLFLSLTGTYARNLARRTRKEPARSLEAFAREHYGERAARTVVVPLIEKWIGLPGERISSEVAWRLPKLDARIALRGIWMKLARKAWHIDPATGSRTLVYPRRGAVQLCEKLAESVTGGVHVGAKLTRLHVDGGEARAADVGGQSVEADAFVSTIPLPELACATGSELGEFGMLRYRALVMLFLQISRDRVSDRLWTWFPEKRFPFYRVAEPKNGARHVAPQDRTMLSIEIPCETEDSLWADTNDALTERVLPHLNEVYGLSKPEILGVDSFRAPCAYPVYDIETEDVRRKLGYRSGVGRLYLAGRTGRFEYVVMEGSYASGRDCAGVVASDLQSAEEQERR